MDVLRNLTVVGINLLKECNHGAHEIARVTLYGALEFWTVEIYQETPDDVIFDLG